MDDEISRRRENATLGTVDVIDPGSGRQFKVENSSNYCWLDHRGVVVGTQTDTSPGAGIFGSCWPCRNRPAPC